MMIRNVPEIQQSGVEKKEKEGGGGVRVRIDESFAYKGVCKDVPPRIPHSCMAVLDLSPGYSLLSIQARRRRSIIRTGGSYLSSTRSHVAGDLKKSVHEIW